MILNICGIDGASPDVKGQFNHQHDWTQFSKYWASDLLLAKKLGFDVVRLGVPWSSVEKEQGVYDWEYADSIIKFCQDINLPIWYNLTQFSYPSWIEGNHAVENEKLGELLIEYTEQFIARYPHIEVYCPFVEITSDAMFRYSFGMWEPHQTNGWEPIAEKMYKDFGKVAKYLKEQDKKVLITENSYHPEYFDPYKDYIDYLGFNYYPQHYKVHGSSMEELLIQWHEAYPDKGICITEFDAFGTEDFRIKILHEDLKPLMEKHSDKLAGVSWYPFLSNIGWGEACTKKLAPGEHDECGLVDYYIDENGQLQRHVLKKLIREYMHLFRKKEDYENI